mmetsp:Transcript_15652/g.24347  ORF Transcript_15652/g.24347 Transcript_15652/m.24347 type:complete len:149 (+) Transcript_15652:68-514(+)
MPLYNNNNNKIVHMIEPEEHRPSEGSNSSANFNLYAHELLSVGLVINDGNSGNPAAESRQITAAIILDEDDFVISKEVRPHKRMRFESAPLFCPRLWSPVHVNVGVRPVSGSSASAQVSEFQMSHFQHAPSVDEASSKRSFDSSSDEE